MGTADGGVATAGRGTRRSRLRGREKRGSDDDAILAAEAAVALVGSMEVLLGVALKDVESDEEESSLAAWEYVFGVDILEGALEDFTLDGEEALLEDSKSCERLTTIDVVLIRVDVLIVSVGMA